MRYKNELYHHGVKGQKWGVRRYQNKDGTLTDAGKKRYERDGDLIIKKGSTVTRVSGEQDDKTYDNKKYVSLNKSDHSKWEDYFGNLYLNMGLLSYNHQYKTVKDLRVMSSTKQGELYTKMLMENPMFASKAVKDTKYAAEFLRIRDADDPAENISRNMAAQTATGKAFVKEVLKRNYDAVVDTHGTNVSKTPVIVLNPDSNLKKIGRPTYTKPVRDFLEAYYGIKAIA